MSAPLIRCAEPADAPAIRAIEIAAFDREDEADIAEALVHDGDCLASLVADRDGGIVGHIVLFRMLLDGAPVIAGLGPVAVHPDRQRSGIGGALIEAGLAELKARGETLCILLGHPDYYPRFGFSTEAAKPFTCKYSGSPAYMALELNPCAPAGGEASWPAAFGTS